MLRSWTALLCIISRQNSHRCEPMHTGNKHTLAGVDDGRSSCLIIASQRDGRPRAPTSSAARGPAGAAHPRGAVPAHVPEATSVSHAQGWLLPPPPLASPVSARDHAHGWAAEAATCRCPSPGRYSPQSANALPTPPPSSVCPARGTRRRLNACTAPQVLPRHGCGGGGRDGAAVCRRAAGRAAGAARLCRRGGPVRRAAHRGGRHGGRAPGPQVG